ncbi:uncharacterized protein LOC114287735 [Camellia sinensis]|uniref:uncharacterized protein LOC114287735 n=1 Tax=Camellia sinensis TaxID=4442 RepID=UPI00103593B8|nr:uncharacterized protein LOC114287735 [Camellia sinensis]
MAQVEKELQETLATKDAEIKEADEKAYTQDSPLRKADAIPLPFPPAQSSSQDIGEFESEENDEDEDQALVEEVPKEVIPPKVSSDSLLTDKSIDGTLAQFDAEITAKKAAEIPISNELVTNESEVRAPNIVPPTSSRAHPPGSTFTTRSRRRKISDRSNFGGRTVTCSRCQAMMWMEEKVRDSPLSRPKFSLCCQSGQVMLPLLPETPEFLLQQFTHVRFREHIRTYNSLLSFTSIGGKIDQSVLDGRGPYVFRISGANFHKIGSLLLEPETRPKFAQLYIYDTEHEIHKRMDVMNRCGGTSGIDTSTLEGLQSMLNVINPYVSIFRTARDMIRENGAQELHIRILSSRDGRQYTRPTTTEIAALIVGDGSESTTNRDIIVRKLDGHFQRINETHPSYMPLQYLLLFPYGIDEWRRSISFTLGTNNKREGVSMREFYAFRLQFRVGEGKTLLQGGRLFQQFVVDCYAAIEQDRLNFSRHKQNVLWIDLYRGLENAVTVGDSDVSAIARRFILPSSFTGGPRLWFSITKMRSQYVERWDFLTFLSHSHVTQIDIHVIEFQKRGLPHSHIILTLSADDKIKSPEEIDDIICAEIPDKDEDLLAFQTVMRCMIHGPYGNANPNAPCMVNRKCSKHYPKNFCSETSIDENGFAIYRRRDTKKKYMVNGFEIDNIWVIPYNRDLIVLYNAHINIEHYAHIKLIKYLYKYIHKGPDRATVVIEDNVNRLNINGQSRYREADEVKQYLDCRYISAIESCWCIFEFELQKKYPSVERLQYHLPGEQSILFRDTDNIPSIINQPGVHETMFTRWFQANRDHVEANTLTYEEFPSSWVWNQKQKKWKMRQQQICIGRLYYAHPNSGERHYLRMLLTKDTALTEASTWASGAQLRNMFCSMLMFSEVTNAYELWENHWFDLTHDLQNRVQRQIGDGNISLEECELKNLGLLEVEHILNQNGRSLKEFPPMPLPSYRSGQMVTNRLIWKELNYNSISEMQSFESLYVGLNDDQLKVFNTIMEAYSTHHGGFFFVL